MKKVNLQTILKYMKASILYTFCLSALIAGCNSSEKKKVADTDTTKTETAVHSTAVIKQLPETFYKRFQGIIGDRNVVLNLIRTENNFSGTYDYNGTRVNLITDTIISQDSIILAENGVADHYSDDTHAGPRLQLKWTGTSFEGLRTDGKEKLSIHLEERYPEGTYAFNIASYADSVKAFPKKKDSPQAIITYKYLTPSGNTPGEQWMDKQLKKVLELQKSTTPWSTGIKGEATDYLKGYKEEIAEIGNDADGPYATLNYYRNQALYLQYNSSNYVIVKYFVDSYSGGAHNNYNTVMYCYDVKNQKRLTLADVVNIDSNALQKLVEKNFRIQYKIKPNEELTSQLFENYLKANNNFFFDNTGLAFMYNPYEVASYAQGQIVVSVPYKELKKYLNPAFVKRMGI